MSNLRLILVGAAMLAFSALMIWVAEMTPTRQPIGRQLSPDYLYGCQQASIGRPRYGPDGYYGDAWHPCPDANGNLTQVYPDPADPTRSRY